MTTVIDVCTFFPPALQLQSYKELSAVRVTEQFLALHSPRLSDNMVWDNIGKVKKNMIILVY